MKISRLKIIRGEDKVIVFLLRNLTSKRPVNLLEATNIQFIFEKQDRQPLILDMVPIPAQKASATFNSGKFIAVNAGSMGNNILLSFDGVKTIDEVVTEWNDLNQSNQVTTSGLIGTFVPSSTIIRLANGLESYIPVTVTNANIGEIRLRMEDRITNSMKIGENQSFKVVVDFGNPPQGVRRKSKIENLLDVIA
jgi:hypothetical protein